MSAERYWEARWRDEKAENKQLRAALSEFATAKNWDMGARFDPNSPRFDGQGFAQHVLDAVHTPQMETK